MDTPTHDEQKCCDNHKSSPRRRLPRSTTALVACTAVVIALASTGGAVAGSLITGKQIKNNTVTTADIKNKTITNKDLAKSARPRTGGQGATGAQGPVGATGATGPAGPVSGVAPSGVTLTGAWALSAPEGTPPAQFTLTGLGLPLRGSGAIEQHTVLPGGAKPPACQGTIWNPTAVPGHICVYVHASRGYDASSIKIQVMASSEHPDSDGISHGDLGPVGGVLEAWTNGDERHYARGVWAYTAA
jgi:hypothetical protein